MLCLGPAWRKAGSADVVFISSFPWGGRKGEG